MSKNDYSQNICLLAEILNNIEHHLLQNDFYLKNNLNQMFVVFFLFIFNKNMICLLELISLLRLIGLLSKSPFVIKFTCAKVKAKFSTVNLLSSGVVKYLS